MKTKAMKTKEQSVTLHVVAYRKAEGLHVQLAVTPEVLDLTRFEAGPVTLRWQLDTAGYEFPSDGTAIAFTSPGSRKSFGAVKVDNGGRLAVVKGKNADGLAYAYNVSVIEKATGLLAVLDPVVQNQGH